MTCLELARQELEERLTWYFVTECQDSDRTCILTLPAHLATVGLHLLLLLLLLVFLKLGPLHWEVFSVGPLDVILVTHNHIN